MTLNEWEQNNIEILTSREMGEWLGRRENRLLDKIRAEIANIASELDVKNATDEQLGIYKCRNTVLNIIDKYTKGVSE